jgi:hypothetical protein
VALLFLITSLPNNELIREAIEYSNCALLEEDALGWTHHQRSAGIVSTDGRGNEIELDH